VVNRENLFTILGMDADSIPLPLAAPTGVPCSAEK
jgi:hypothetical protein